LAFIMLDGWPPDLSNAVSIAIGVIFGCGVFMKIRDVVGRYLSLASNAPLKQTIHDNIDVGMLRAAKPPVYCTMARETTWWDPFEVSTWSHVSDGAKRHGRTPLYLSVGDAASDGEAMDWLIQTAALPEIFPRKPIRGQFAVDGGVVDNVPIYPIAAHKVDRVIVVYLGNELNASESLYTDEAARTWWMAELVAWSELDTRAKANAVRRNHIKKNGPIGEKRPNLIPLEPRLLRPEQFVPILPMARLGNFLTGTLNFSGEKARRLLKRGYRDTLLWIQAFATLQAASGQTGRSAHDLPRSSVGPEANVTVPSRTSKYSHVPDGVRRKLEVEFVS